jgi:hypothetical protein
MLAWREAWAWPTPTCRGTTSPNDSPLGAYLAVRRCRYGAPHIAETSFLRSSSRTAHDEPLVLAMHS